MNDCKHDFEFRHSTGYKTGRKVKGKKCVPLTFGFTCKKCKESLERKATPGEINLFYNQLDGDIFGKIHIQIHAVWHEFVKKFKRNEKIQSADGQEYLMAASKYKYCGGELMDKIDEWAKKYPNDVKVLNVDDSYHMGSCIYLIEHQTENEYMGTTCVYVPQMGDEPAEFFLYPMDRDRMIKELIAIKKYSRPIKAKQNKNATEKAKLTKKNIKHPAVL